MTPRTVRIGARGRFHHLVLPLADAAVAQHQTGLDDASLRLHRALTRSGHGSLQAHAKDVLRRTFDACSLTHFRSLRVLRAPSVKRALSHSDGRERTQSRARSGVRPRHSVSAIKSGWRTDSRFTAVTPSCALSNTLVLNPETTQMCTRLNAGN